MFSGTTYVFFCQTCFLHVLDSWPHPFLGKNSNTHFNSVRCSVAQKGCSVAQRLQSSSESGSVVALQGAASCVAQEVAAFSRVRRG
jgi:hypothetical protein